MFVILYGGKPGDSLATLRYTGYMRMAASSSRIVPAKLPPTERSAYFHSLRVYLQVSYFYIAFCVSLYFHICQWRDLDNCNMNSLDWGWKIQGDKMVPVMTDQVIFLHCIKILESMIFEGSCT